MKQFNLISITCILLAFSACSKRNINETSENLSIQKDTPSGTNEISISSISFNKNIAYVLLKNVSSMVKVSVKSVGASSESFKVSSNIFMFKYLSNVAYSITISTPNQNPSSFSFINPLKIMNTNDHSVPFITGQVADILNKNCIVLKINTSVISGFVNYKIVYRIPNSNSKWKLERVASNNGKIVLPDLAPNTNYEVKIARICNSITTTGYSNSFFCKSISSDME